MYITAVILIFKVCLLHSGSAFILPRSPCPSIFHNEWIGDSSGKNDVPLKGVITVRWSLPIFLKVKLQIPTALFTEYGGRLTMAERRPQPDQKINPGLEEVKYNLYYPKNVPLPQIILIEVNNKILCSSNPIHTPVKTTVIWEHSLRPNTAVEINRTKDYGKFDVRSDHSAVRDSLGNELIQQTENVIQGANVAPPSFQATAKETCGKPIKATPLIVGGAQARRGDWPWMVPLFKRTDLGVQFTCGATLISDQFVVTAAHCLKEDGNAIADKSDLIAYTGRFDIKNWIESNTQPKEIDEVYVHPDFDAETLYSDLALLKLKEKVRISQFVNPACLWAEEEDLNYIVGTRGLIFGWGMDERGRKFTDKPNLAIMPIVSQEECLRSNPELVFWTSDKTFCAGSRKGSGPCHGDSGAGLLLPRTDKDGINRWYLRGVVSLSLLESSDSTLRCNLDEFIVFTDIAKYKTWISDILSET